MLTTIDIEGFKCIDQQRFHMNRLTLLTGMNSAGKSTVVQALLLLVQKNRKEKMTSSLRGQFVNLGNFNDVRNYVTGSKEIVIKAEFQEQAWERATLTMHRGETSGLLKSKAHYETAEVHPIEGEIQRELRAAESVVASKNIVYLSADRIGAEDIYEKNPEQNGNVGVRCEFAFDYLSRNGYDPIQDQDFIRDAQAGVNLGNQVDYWLNYILGYSVRAEDIEDTDKVKASFASQGRVKYLRPKNVGTGVSYVASMIISALSCQKDDLFIVENPEIHLHPKAQSLVIEFFTFLASKGLQVIIETHSDHIYNGVRKLVKAKKIRKEDTSIYFFRKDAEELCVPEQIILDDYGVVANHPSGLFDQFDDDLDELLGLK